MSNTHTIKAWHTSPEYARLEDLNDPDRLCFSNGDMRSVGWLLVGEADITLRIDVTPEELATSMCDTLKKQIEDIRAKSQKEINELQERVNRLQSLTYEVKKND